MAWLDFLSAYKKLFAVH